MSQLTLPELKQAESEFRQFIVNQGLSSNFVWLTRENTLEKPYCTFIRIPVRNNDAEIKALYELGKERELGVEFLIVGTVEGTPYCMIRLPLNEHDARRKGNPGLSFGFFNHFEEHQLIPIRNRWSWWWKKQKISTTFSNYQKANEISARSRSTSAQNFEDLPEYDPFDIDRYRIKISPPLFHYFGVESFQIAPLQSLSSEEIGKGWLTLVAHLDDQWGGKFSERNPLNIPGPFYGADTDSCETGPISAPDNILLDPNGQEFVFRQPDSYWELLELLEAARCECFSGYAADGNDHWTLSLLREWWQQSLEMVAAYEKEQENVDYLLKAVTRYKHYLETDAEKYLQRYAFFLEQGQSPQKTDILPEI